MTTSIDLKKIITATALILLTLPAPTFAEGSGSNLRFLNQGQTVRDSEEWPMDRKYPDKKHKANQERDSDRYSREPSRREHPRMDTPAGRQDVRRTQDRREQEYHQAQPDSEKRFRRVEPRTSEHRRPTAVNREERRPEPPRYESQDIRRTRDRREPVPDERHRWIQPRTSEHRRTMIEHREVRRPEPARYEHSRKPERAFTRVYHRLPPKHRTIRHGHYDYHWYNGRYYRKSSGGFMLVTPPFGLVVFDLPFGFRTVVSSGQTYYEFGNVFYRRVAGGYQVVPPIRSHSYSADRVSVTVPLLNVRYAPSQGDEVVAQVYRYQTLNVLGSVPGWLYVEIPGEGIQGWVMERFVVPGYGRG